MIYEYLTDEEINKLPEIKFSEVQPDQEDFMGILYNQQGMAIGRTYNLPLFLEGKHPKRYLKNQEENKSPQPILWSDFDRSDIPPLQWRIKNLVPSEGFTIIASPSGEKKTWISLEMARCIANGTPFLNEFITKEANVLYIDQEMAKSEIQRRGRMLGLNETKNKIFLLSQNEFNLNNKNNAEWLFNFVEENDIKTIFVDTFRAVANGLKEEKAEEVRTFFNMFKPFKDKDVAMVFLDHCRKPLRMEGKTPKKEQLFASQDKVASVEILLMVKSDAGSNDIFIYQTKNRVAKEIAPFKILLEDSLDIKGDEKICLKFAGNFDERESKEAEAIKLINSALEDSEHTAKELIEIGQSEWKIGEKNIRSALRTLEDQEVITSIRKGREKLYRLNKQETTEKLANDLFNTGPD